MAWSLLPPTSTGVRICVFVFPQNLKLAPLQNKDNEQTCTNMKHSKYRNQISQPSWSTFKTFFMKYSLNHIFSDSWLFLLVYSFIYKKKLFGFIHTELQGLASHFVHSSEMTAYSPTEIFTQKLSQWSNQMLNFNTLHTYNCKTALLVHFALINFFVFKQNCILRLA